MAVFISYSHKDQEIVEKIAASLVKENIHIWIDKWELNNEIEEAYYNADGVLDSKKGYAYEYDNVGNWTKKTESKEVTKFGKTYFEPQSVTIRTIKYYP